MAYVLRRIGTTPNIPYRHFECDEIADLVTIDLYLAPMGSTCYVINTGDMYKLNGKNEWVLMSSGSTPSNPDDPDNPGGGGGEPNPQKTYIWDGGEI
jgi:hypothetical protein